MTLSRRDLLRQTLGVTPLVLASGCAGWLRPRRDYQEQRADIVIIGGGLGGCAAALAACRRGQRVIMTEETDWIGGQLTQQGVPPDENAWIETIGGTASYAALRRGLRDFYRQHPRLLARARNNPRLNPGNCWVSRIGCEPRAGVAVLEAMLAPHVASGQLTILREHRAVRADVDGARIRSIEMESIGGRHVVLHADYFLDATELGDLLPMTGTEYVSGAESQRDTGEPHAPVAADPGNIQSFTVCFAIEHLPGEHHTIDRPADYATWRAMRLMVDGAQAPPLITFEDADSTRIGFDPVTRKGYWTYRRVIDRDLFEPGTYRSDITIVNWIQNDYSLGSLIDVSREEAATHIARAHAQNRALLYWLQTEAPRPDGGTGWPGLRLRPDVMGTTDGWAKYPYIREGRRIRAEVTIREQDVLQSLRQDATGLPPEQLTATVFDDSVGIGHYSMDLHLTTRGNRGQYGTTLPFQIPLGALIPQRVENLIPACKNIGTTHLTNGCYRLHPIEWNIGESAGALASRCVARKLPPRAVRNRLAERNDFQRELTRDGIPLQWPHPLPPR